MIFVYFLACGFPYAGTTAIAMEKGDTGGCDGISIEEAAVILGKSPDDLLKSSNDGLVSPDDIRKKTYKVPPCTCRIKSKSDYLKSVNYIIYIYNDPGRARDDFDTMRTDFKVVAKVDDTPGLGDQAFRAVNSHLERMVALKGGVLIDVLTPGDFARQKRVVELVLREF
jgi:hypothetical protein